MGFSIINRPFWGTPISGNRHLDSFRQFLIFLRFHSAILMDILYLHILGLAPRVGKRYIRNLPINQMPEAWPVDIRF